MLKYAKTLHLDEDINVIQERMDRWFEERQYQIRHDAKGDVYYERGSKHENRSAHNPSRWHAFAYINMEIAQKRVTSLDVQLHVDTSWQYVLGRERRYLETEFDLFTTFLETGKIKREDILGDLGRFNEQRNRFLIAILCVVLGLLIGAGLCSYMALSGDLSLTEQAALTASLTKTLVGAE